MQRTKLCDFLEERVNKALEGSGAPGITVRMLYHGFKEFNLADRLVRKRYVHYFVLCVCRGNVH